MKWYDGSCHFSTAIKKYRENIENAKMKKKKHIKKLHADDRYNSNTIYAYAFQTAFELET